MAIPYNVPTSEIDLEFPCGDCEIYKGGDDSCLDCPVKTRYYILIGDGETAAYCLSCDRVLWPDRLYGLPMLCRCGGAVEVVKAVQR